MSYTSLPSVTTGDTLTAAQWNTWVKDNFAALWTGTAAGDIGYFTSSSARTKLAIGTYGQIMRVKSDASAPEWQAGFAVIGGILHKQLLLTSFTPTKTTGCALGQVYEMGTNKNCYMGWAFDKDAIEYAFMNFVLPFDYKSEGTIYAQFSWMHQAGTAFKVAWQAQGVAITNDGALDVALGTAVAVNDEGGTNNDLYVTGQTGEITLAGTPQAGKLVNLVVSRKATDGTNDTLDADAILTQVMIWYPVN